MIRLAFDLPSPSSLAVTEGGDLSFTANNIENAVFETYSNMYKKEQRNCTLGLEFTSREEELLDFRKANMLYLLVKSAGYDSCVPDDSEIVIFSQEMTRQHKRTVIAQIYKFETISSAIFAVTLISCHLELARTKQSFFDRQRSNRDYSSRLSILTNSLALIWIFGLAIFYLSLALVYGRFTWYFCWPSLILGAMAGIYMTQQIIIQLKAQ